MLEIVALFVLAVAAWYFLPFFSKSKVVNQSTCSNKLKVPEDSVLKRHFLTHLQSEIESALFPRPTDSVLQRHYDSLVTAELENRLAQAE
jgi:hypothetical protein